MLKKFLLDRPKKNQIFSIVFLLSFIYIFRFLAIETWFSSEHVSVNIVINNHTNEVIGPFTILDDQNLHVLTVNQIEPKSKVSVYYKIQENWGENAIYLRDINGKEYVVIGYFENRQKGGAEIYIECLSPDGLSGKIRDKKFLFSRYEWRAWGVADCQ